MRLPSEDDISQPKALSRGSCKIFVRVFDLNDHKPVFTPADEPVVFKFAGLDAVEAHASSVRHRLNITIARNTCGITPTRPKLDPVRSIQTEHELRAFVSAGRLKFQRSSR